MQGFNSADARTENGEIGKQFLIIMGKQILMTIIVLKKLLVSLIILGKGTLLKGCHLLFFSR